MIQIYAKGIHGEVRCFSSLSLLEILQSYHVSTGIPIEYLRASQNSKPIIEVNPQSTLYISLKVCGGKGGFGSLLRGQGMIARVNNFDACRDLNGRRIRDVNNEIRLAEWKEKQQEKKKLESEDKEETEKSRQNEVKIPQKRPNPAGDKYKNDLKSCVGGMKSALADGLKKMRKQE